MVARIDAKSNYRFYGYFICGSEITGVQANAKKDENDFTDPDGGFLTCFR
jgi:hypothetical protein